MTNNRTRSLWKEALSSRAVWRRSLMIGIGVGVIQILVNQGDHWWHRRIDGVLVMKTLTTPLIAISVALISSAGSLVQLQQDQTFAKAARSSEPSEMSGTLI